jgi:hypothetical protein
VPNNEGKQGEREWEAIKLYFEFFKHFTTLTTAIALISIGFFGVLNLKPQSFVMVLIALAIPLLLSLAGMVNALLHAQSWGFWKFDFDRDPGTVPFILAALTVMFFIFALLAVVLAAAPPPPPGSSSGCVFPGPPFC